MPPSEPALSTDDDLLASLDATPVGSWIERRQAISPKVAEARELAAKKLEPKSVTVKPKSATLKTAPEVESKQVRLPDQFSYSLVPGL